MRVLRYIWKQASVIALLLLFSGGWLATPAALLLPEPITCGMECCEESGECCCFMSRQMQANIDGNADNEPQLAVFSKGCESNCAIPPASNNFSLAQKDLPTAVGLTLIARKDRLIHQRVNPRSFALCRRSAPRAPPSCV